ncbi:hypothetical protein EYC79_03780 [Agrobacterium cavarae]|uniref:Uncharacterized protein n=1 Tax=Agrobacterium cavarae TaxID=2528239 RepID=A0ABY1YBQ3_9HYPH|nr:hypothetical protein [Agrobacterium cavarae]TBN16941.1 hypothetical protein EYC79_03780 [Agrobacterium cavarae]
MAKAPTKAQITRAIEAAKAGGVSVGRIEIEGLKITIVPAAIAAAVSADLGAGETISPYKAWKAANAHKA